MPRRYALSDLRNRCIQRADLEGDLSIATDECNRLISEAYGELYTIVFECGLQYFEFAAQLTSTGAATLSELADHLSTVALTYYDGTQYYALREMMSQERIPASRWATGSRAYAFALVDDKIYLYPTPPAGQIYELRYVPQPPELSTFADTDVVDVVTPDGLTFLVWSVCVKLKSKAESDVQLAIAEREAARDRFTTSVQLRSLNTPRRRVVETDDDDDGVWW